MNHVDYSDSDLLIFCHISKTAGGSLWQSVSDHFENSTDGLVVSKHNPKKFYNQSHYNVKRYDKFNFRSISRITLMRDPLDRFLSEHYFIAHQENFSMYCPLDIVDEMLPDYINRASNLSLMPVQFSLRSFLFDWQIEKFGSYSFDHASKHFRHLTRNWTYLKQSDLDVMTKKSIAYLSNFDYVGHHSNVSHVLKLVCDFMEVPNETLLSGQMVHSTPYKKSIEFLKEKDLYLRAKKLLAHDYNIYGKFIVND